MKIILAVIVAIVLIAGSLYYEHYRLNKDSDIINLGSYSAPAGSEGM